MRRLLLAAAACAAFAPWAARAQTAPLPTLTIGLGDDADILDPTLARTFVGRIVFAGLCDKLFDINARLEIVPQLATSWQWTDSRTLLIHLRQGVLFQDGTRMDAAAVKYSLDRHLTMPGSTRKAEISAIDHVEVVDPSTVRLVLKTPNAPLLAALADRAGMIVSPKAAEAEGKNFGQHPVCTGPFSFSERVAQDHITLTRFSGYWNAKSIHFSKVIYRPITDSSVRLANLDAGSLDIAERIAPTDVPAVRKNPKLRLALYAGLGYQGITFNTDNGPVAKNPLGENALVRKAFELSIDRTALVQVVYSGLFPAVAQGLPPASPFFAKSVQPPKRDVAAARALLKQAGVKTPVDVTLTVTNTPDQRQTGEVIQSMAQEAGFNVKINSVEFTTGLSASAHGDLQAYLVGWSGRADPDGNLYSFLHTGAPLNDGHYSSKEMDSLLDAGRTTTDLAARQAIYAKQAALEEKDLPIMYLYSPRTVDAMKKQITGFQEVPDAMIRLQGLALGK
ncbi:MAG: ABC transporter substrate-binding protein [Rhodospirillales bacterium]|nr:ABC transporter substrate-binding protein [Rhodospirillales bacterium]MDE2198534.1 ABC transporter substrate-binding protein [Rhodospirillales bacterium]MDE2576559.1 ABC transporter substrate-binding protein [Rhodospirillales bacterium]